MKVINTIPHNSMRSIGKCIYCGSLMNLSDEHIIPHGLGGPWVLQKASCQKCAAITSEFERDIVKYYFSLVRAKLDLPTYHKKHRPTSFEFSIKRDNKKETANFLTNDCPIIFMMPIFDKPGYILNEGVKTGYKIKGTTLHGYGVEKFAKEQNIQSLTFSTQLLGMNFPRFLAKIAYGIVVLQYGLDMIKDNYVIPCILGNKNDVGHWVGCENPDQSPALLPKDQLFYKIQVFSKGCLVGAIIRLFAIYQTPEYIVIVGQLKDNYENLVKL
jgi:hypothetical protein